MSNAEDLLNNLPGNMPILGTTNPQEEGHIVIGEDRVIRVPDELKRIAVQNDNRIETVTFDCPRYWDNHDLTEMNIFIHYITRSNARGVYLAKNVTVDPVNPDIIHFTWTVSEEISVVNGDLQILVAAKKTVYSEGKEIRWYSEINNEMRVSRGLDNSEYVYSENPDIINDLITRMDTIIYADTPILDTSLTQAGLAAEAKVTGDSIRTLNNTLSEKINNNVSNLQIQINGLASGSPKGTYTNSAAIRLANPDTGVYITTSNGHIYSWTKNQTTDPIDLGVYQATEIADGSITILKLDELLKSSFNKEYENVPYNTNQSGFVKIVNDAIQFVSDSGYHYARIELEVNTIYEFGGYNIGQLIGFIIVNPNDNNKIIYSSNDGLTTGTRNFSSIFKTNISGLVAYISKRNVNNIFEDNALLFTKISNISLNHSVLSSVNLLKRLNNYYLRRNSTIGNYPNLISSEHENDYISIYKLSKGIKYKIHSANYVEIAGLMILDENSKITYTSSTTQVRPLTYFDYEFIAENNGFACLQNYNDGTSSIESSIEIVDAFLNEINNLKSDLETLSEIVNEPYKNKTWVAVGDSLTAVSTLGEGVKNYTNYVSEKLGLTMSNFGIGGTGYWRGHTNNNAFYQRINNIPIDTNIITIFGSFNDLGVEDGVTGTNIIGNITDTTNETLCGCINLTINTIIQRCPNAIIGIFSPTPWSDCNRKQNTTRGIKSIEYVDKLKQICELNSIPFLNLYDNSNLRPWDNTFKNTFYNNADGVHPNTNGHKRISAQIQKFIERIIFN